MDQQLLPKASSQFASAEYWTQFFEKRQGRAFEWYLDSDAVCELLFDALPAGASCCLHLGCGSSQVATRWGLQARPPLVFLHSDYVPVAVAETQLSLRAHVALGAPGCDMVAPHDFLALDARAVPLRESIVDVVLSKGLVDAMFYNYSSGCLRSMKQLLCEVSDTLRSGGLYVVISLLQEHTRRLLEEAVPDSFVSLCVTPLQPPFVGELRPFLLKLQKASGQNPAASQFGLVFETETERFPSGLQKGHSLDTDRHVSAGAMQDWEALWAHVLDAQSAFEEFRSGGKGGVDPQMEEKQTICSVQVDLMPRTQSLLTDLDALRFQLLLLARKPRDVSLSAAISGLLGWSEVEIQPIAFGLKKLSATAIIDPSVLQPEDFVAALCSRFEMTEDGEDDDIQVEESSTSRMFAVERVKSVTLVDIRFGDIAAG